MRTSLSKRLSVGRIWALVFGLSSFGSTCSGPKPPPIAGPPDSLFCTSTLQRCIARDASGCTQLSAPVIFETNHRTCDDLSVDNTQALQDAQCQRARCTGGCIATNDCVCASKATGTGPGQGCDVLPTIGVVIGGGSAGSSGSGGTGGGTCVTPSQPGVSSDAVCQVVEGDIDANCCAPFTCSEFGSCGCTLAPPDQNANPCDPNRELQMDASGNPVPNGQGGFLRATRPQCCDGTLHCVNNPSGVLSNGRSALAVCGQCKLQGEGCDVTKGNDCCLGEGDCTVPAGSVTGVCLQNGLNNCVGTGEQCRFLTAGGGFTELNCCGDLNPNTGKTDPPSPCPNPGVAPSSCE